MKGKWGASQRPTPETSGNQVPTDPSLGRVPLGTTGLMVSPAGFGGYRIDARIEEHFQALALASGVNLIDTSSNYTDGQSEILIGQVLRELFQQGRLKRQQVVVVSKAGYLQGQNYERGQDGKRSGRPWPELVEYGPGLDHCLHPEFLADQISRSLARLQLERLDALLLHNPEYYLAWAEKQGLPLAAARQEYYRRLGQALAHLEAEAQAGRIAFYGISSNTFVTPAERYDHTCLARCWDLAQALGPDHGFRVVQMPLNLLEAGAALNPNQPTGETTLALASRLGLGLLTNRPLNAISSGRLIRLAEVEDAPASLPADQAITQAIEALADSEQALRRDHLPNLGWDQARQDQIMEFLAAAPVLAEHWQDFQDLAHWRQASQEHFIPRIGAALRYMFEAMGSAPPAREVVEAHLARVQQAFDLLGGLYAFQAAREGQAIGQRAAAADPDWAQAPRLSQRAIRAVRSTAGVSSVLVGMRSEQYVHDVLQELARPVEQRERQEAWRGMAGPA